eukprot:TRINITY_DN9803_c1_g1_i9.p1 TRINITY_DN9803_c1_g1~~TRINITY_DN9803_c1_g1_i9.p1  ORF type:complete len:131 (+),score=0.03 TRINITY_DN9803_c1_g1_i9:502-894(+)
MHMIFYITRQQIYNCMVRRRILGIELTNFPSLVRVIFKAEIKKYNINYQFGLRQIRSRESSQQQEEVRQRPHASASSSSEHSLQSGLSQLAIANLKHLLHTSGFVEVAHRRHSSFLTSPSIAEFKHALSP